MVGIAFQTTTGVTLSPNQDGSPAQVIAPVEALESGAAGNVLAETISIAPSLESQGISVSTIEKIDPFPDLFRNFCRGLFFCQLI